MAVAAYASLVSLSHVLDNLHYRAPFHLPLWDIKQIEMLQENVHFLLDFVELHSGNQSPGIEHVCRQMAEVAFEAEDKIDIHVVSQLNMKFQAETYETDLSLFFEDMDTLISKIDFIKQELPAIEEEEEISLVVKQPSPSVPAGGSASTHTSSNNVVVGIDEHVVQIMDQLTRDESNLQILPIVGMGGIGKTTLAKSIFDHSYVVNYFDMRMWITISQEYSIEQILMGLLEGRGNKGTSESLVELGERLYKKLFGKKYLIVMDDVWTINAWDDFKRVFPNIGVGRILLTTRLANVASCLGSIKPYSLTFLDEDKSWDLFCQITFGHIGCPYVELEEIGKEIAKSCRGLPLEIVILGRLLANSDMTPEYWKFVAKDVNSFGNLEDDEHCLKVLYLSFNGLPICLKPCFLYLRVYPEDASIHVYELLNFWIAEGFIKPSSDRSLEECAYQYLEDLIDRNLIFRRREMETFGIHDLLLDLCLRESNKECFLRSPKVQRLFPHLEYLTCFFCGHIANLPNEGINLGKLTVVYPSTVQASSFVCDACKVIYSHITRLRLLRTMDGLYYDTWQEIEQPTEVRYCFIYFFYELKFISLHLLWNLQILSIYSFSLSPIPFPQEIWEMPQLRHITASYQASLPDPGADHVEGEDFIVLKNLQTLSEIQNFKCTKEILDRVPNLKELHICYENEAEGDTVWSSYSLNNLDQLKKLEILHIRGALEDITFPNSLKELFLVNCKMAWEDMSIIGSLANLKRLVLDGGIEGCEWNPNEGEFLRLKRLTIESTELVYWRADETHFPVLQELQLRNLYSLEEIPSGIGDIPTLQVVVLTRCNDSVINSGKQMCEEQHSMGNESFQMHIDGERYEMEDEDSDS